MNIKFRIYTDGTVISEDDFKEWDKSMDYGDDFEVVYVEALVVEHIENVVLGK